MKKTDRRILKTQQELLDAFVSLSKEKEINDVSVSELTKRAGISRATFYLHYKDPDDMLQQLSQQLLTELVKMIEKEKSKSTMAAFYGVFRCIRENEKIASLILSTDTTLTFVYQMDRLVRQLFKEDFAEEFDLSAANAKTTNYLITFIVGGSAGIILKWFEEGMQESEEEMGHLLYQTVIQGARYIGQEKK